MNASTTLPSVTTGFSTMSQLSSYVNPLPSEFAYTEMATNSRRTRALQSVVGTSLLAVLVGLRVSGSGAGVRWHPWNQPRCDPARSMDPSTAEST